MLEGASRPRRGELRTLIVDDEPLGREAVRLALSREPDIRIVGECADGDEAIEAIERLSPDLVFLDIQMPRTDGFDVIRAIGPERMPAVVFVTGYDEHALPAFELHALDYVLKPFDRDRFTGTLNHVRRFLERGLDAALRERLRELLESTATDPARTRYTKRIMVRVRNRVRVVAVDEVDWFESAGNYVRIRTADDAFLVRRTLSSLVDALDPSRFARIHRSTIVNLDRISELRPVPGGDFLAVLKDGRKLRVSRAYRDVLL